MKMEQTVCSETPAYKILTPRNYPEESIQHSEHGESFKSRIISETTSKSNLATPLETNATKKKSYTCCTGKQHIL